MERWDGWIHGWDGWIDEWVDRKTDSAVSFHHHIKVPALEKSGPEHFGQMLPAAAREQLEGTALKHGQYIIFIGDSENNLSLLFVPLKRSFDLFLPLL